MSEVMQPTHANFLGKVFGGSVLALIDICAYATASRFAGMVCVTASIDQVDFHEPIEVGEFVKFIGVVSYVGRTSVEVTIEVHAEDIFKRTSRHTNTARVTMVALLGDRPAEVPRLVCETREERLRFLAGRLRRTMRAQHRSQIEDAVRQLNGASDAEISAMFDSP